MASEIILAEAAEMQTSVSKLCMHVLFDVVIVNWIVYVYVCWLHLKKYYFFSKRKTIWIKLIIDPWVFPLFYEKAMRL